ncbi:tetratricopeptide repeat protein [Candidatus Neomarinimicrobiota bacterium]
MPDKNHFVKLPGWIANLLLIAVPILLLAVLEIGLRVFNAGADLRTFIPTTFDETLITTNQMVGKRFFAGEEYASFGTQDMFKAIKKPNTLRIFAFGGSSAAGYPYMFSGTFPAMLEQRLALLYPAKEVEVINMGMTAITSYTVLEFARAALDWEPDLFVVYMGHNEFYGTLGSASTSAIGSSYRLTWLYLQLSHSKIFQLLKAGLRKSSQALAEGQPEDNTTLMARMVKDEAIPIDSELYRVTIDNFRKNLERLVRLAADNNIPIVVGQPVSNLADQPPFVSIASGDRSEVVAAIKAAGESVKSGQVEDAVKGFAAAIAVDTAYANAWYGYGKALEKSGRTLDAVAAYTRASDLDGLRFRASSDITKIIEETVTGKSAHIAKLDSAMLTTSERGVIGSEYILEHLHPNIDGYFEIARQFAQIIVDSVFAGQPVAAKVDEMRLKELIAVTPLDSAIAGYRIKLLVSGWPFTSARSMTLTNLPVHKAEDKFAKRMLSKELNYERVHVEMAEYYADQGDHQSAAREYYVLSETFPHNDSPLLLLVRELIALRDFDRALPYLIKASSMSNDAFSLKWAGTILLERGQVAEALPYLQRAVEVSPLDGQGRFNLAGAYFKSESNEKALKELRRLLQRQPGFPGAQEFYDQLNQAVAKAELGTVN